VQSGKLFLGVFSHISINIHYMKTWENLEVGDKVRNLAGTRTILAKVQDMYVVSSHDRDSVSAKTFTKEEFQDCGYEIVQPEETGELQYYLPHDLSRIVYAKVPTLITGADSGEGRDSIPLYRLDDLMRAIVELGKINDWDSKPNEIRLLERTSHILLMLYIDDGYRLDGEKVREFILKTFA
jgi:hypothetical protein